LDALRVKIRGEGLVRNKEFYIALRGAAEGTKDVLGSWTCKRRGRRVLGEVMS
jgi:putative transposase